MAFTFRTEKNHDIIIKRICKNTGFKTKTKALLWMVENIEQIIEDRDNLNKKVLRLERELATLKRAVRNKLEADRNLSLCVSEADFTGSDRL